MVIMATFFTQIQKPMQQFNAKKPLESNGTSFIVIASLEPEILYFKEWSLPNLPITC